MTLVCCPTAVLPKEADSCDYTPQGQFTIVYEAKGENSLKKRRVLFIPDIFGFHPLTVKTCDEIAKRGNYTVIFPDFFNNNPWPSNEKLGEGEKWEKFYKLITSEEMYQRVKEAAVKIQKEYGQKPLCIGACFGSKMAFRLAAEDLVQSVSAPHPSFVDTELAAQAKCKVGLYPSKDDGEMKDVKAVLEENNMLFNYFYAVDAVHGYSAARHDPKDEKSIARREQMIVSTLELFKATE